MPAIISSEHEYWKRQACEVRSGRLAAEAVNDMMTPAEAMAFEIAVTAFPQESAGLVEAVFDALGWPKDNLSELHLTTSGQSVWKAYQIYRGL